MNVFSEIESLMILCFYKYEKGRNVQRFTRQFNDFFNKDVGEQTILYELSIVKSAEIPANMPDTPERTFYRELWHTYSSGVRGVDLSQLYRDFKAGKYIEKRGDSKEQAFDIYNSTVTIKDEPILTAEIENISVSEAERRSRRMAIYALSMSGYKCECNCTNELFLRKDGKTPYTEAHHFIPLHYQREFKFSLDVPANIVSLCPYCHRKLHYGYGIEEMLDVLYKKRKNRLAQCGIEINMTDILLMYR